MKILHTADWHLGRSLHHQSLLDLQRDVLQQMVDLAIDQQVAAVLVSGDIYDRSVPPAEAVTLLNETVDQLVAADIALVMISGNHDGPERLGFGAKPLTQAGVHLHTDVRQVDQPVVITQGATSVEVFAVPFCDPQTVRDAFQEDAEGAQVKDFDQAHTFLVEKARAARHPSRPSLLMSHCFVDGADVCDSERTLSVGGSDRVSYEPMLGFDYVALGHLHRPQSKGASHICYSGSPMKYSFSEAGHHKGVQLLTLDASGLVAQAHWPLQPQRDVRVLQGALPDLIAQAPHDPNRDDFLMVRLQEAEALLDPMGQLRAVYPNVLHLERPSFELARHQSVARDNIRRNEHQLIADFYE